MRRRRFGRVRKLPSGRWQSRVSTPDGGDRSLGVFGTKRDAERALAAAETDQARGSWLDPRAGDQPFGEYAERWMATRNLRPMTRQLYERQLRLRILPTFGPVPLGKISPQLVREWHARLLVAVPAGEKGAVTVATSYRTLRAILGTAVEDELLPRNPCAVKGAGAVRSSARPEVSVGQVRKLAQTVPHRYGALVWLAAATALRSAELSALRRGDIDFVRRVVRVERQFVELDGKPGYFGPPKTAAGARVVPLPAVVVPVLLKHLSVYVDRQPDALVFTTSEGRPLSRRNRSWWRRACRIVGLESGTHLHDLRHAGLTMAAQSGATLRELMVLAGHSSPRAALIYQHATQDRAAVIAERMSDLLERPEGTGATGT